MPNTLRGVRHLGSRLAIIFAIAPAPCRISAASSAHRWVERSMPRPPMPAVSSAPRHGRRCRRSGRASPARWPSTRHRSASPRRAGRPAADQLFSRYSWAQYAPRNPLTARDAMHALAEGIPIGCPLPLEGSPPRVLTSGRGCAAARAGCGVDFLKVAGPSPGGRRPRPDAGTGGRIETDGPMATLAAPWRVERVDRLSSSLLGGAAFHRRWPPHLHRAADPVEPFQVIVVHVDSSPAMPIRRTPSGSV